MKEVKISRTAKYMLLSIAGLYFLFLAIGLVVIFFLKEIEPPLPYALGLLLGCIGSAVKVLLLERSISNALDKESDAAKSYTQLQYMLRFGITIIVFLIIVFNRKYLGIIGGIVGFLTMQISAYVTNIILKKKDYPED